MGEDSMSAEIQPTSFADIVRLQSKETPQMTPVGAILFNQRRNLIFLASDPKGELTNKSLDIAKNKQAEAFSFEGDRVIDMGNFRDVSALQVNLAGVEIAVHESIKTTPSVY